MRGQASSFHLLEPLPISPHLAGCDVKSSLKGRGCDRVRGGWQQRGEGCSRVVFAAGIGRGQWKVSRCPGRGGVRESVVVGGSEGGGDSWCLLQRLMWGCWGGCVLEWLLRGAAGGQLRVDKKMLIWQR